MKGGKLWGGLRMSMCAVMVMTPPSRLHAGPHSGSHAEEDATVPLHHAEEDATVPLHHAEEDATVPLHRSAGSCTALFHQQTRFVGA